MASGLNLTPLCCVWVPQWLIGWLESLRGHAGLTAAAQVGTATAEWGAQKGDKTTTGLTSSRDWSREWLNTDILCVGLWCGNTVMLKHKTSTHPKPRSLNVFSLDTVKCIHGFVGNQQKPKLFFSTMLSLSFGNLQTKECATFHLQWQLVPEKLVDNIDWIYVIVQMWRMIC